MQTEVKLDSGGFSLYNIKSVFMAQLNIPKVDSLTTGHTCNGALRTRIGIDKE